MKPFVGKQELLTFQKVYFSNPFSEISNERAEYIQAD
jgi:hypothetical protein